MGEVHVEKDGIVHVIEVDDDGNPINAKKETKVIEEKKKSVWLEWQFYLFLIFYFFLHSFLRALLLDSSSVMGILHFVLIEETYRRIWLENKEITFKKLGKTFLWLLIGNVILLVIAVVFALLIGY